MASNAGPTHEDYDDAARLWLLGLMAGQELDSIMEQLTALHSHSDTFPAEVLLELAAEAIEESEASPAEPIQYEGMHDRYLPECHFRGGDEPPPSVITLTFADRPEIEPAEICLVNVSTTRETKSGWIASRPSEFWSILAVGTRFVGFTELTFR